MLFFAGDVTCRALQHIYHQSTSQQSNFSWSTASALLSTGYERWGDHRWAETQSQHNGSDGYQLHWGSANSWHTTDIIWRRSCLSHCDTQQISSREENMSTDGWFQVLGGRHRWRNMNGYHQETDEHKPFLQTCYIPVPFLMQTNIMWRDGNTFHRQRTRQQDMDRQKQQTWCHNNHHKCQNLDTS